MAAQENGSEKKLELDKDAFPYLPVFNIFLEMITSDALEKTRWKS